MPATLKLSKFFLDRPAVIRAVGAARAKALGREGALVRTIARNSLRSSKSRIPIPPGAPWGRRGGTMWRPAPPGKPPLSHAGQLRLIFFSYDRATQSEVVGPIPFARGEAAQLNEFGGTVTRRGHGGRRFRARYPRRPFMAPALERAAPNLATAWKNSVHP